jgi:hypothetical protein
MRIERVVGGTFNEASERSRELFGPSVMLISSARVGDVHELLVCTETAENDENDQISPVDRSGKFAATLQAELSSSRTSGRPIPRVVPTVMPTQAAAVKAAADPLSKEQGAALVNVIRKELHALETRLAGNSGTVRGLSQKMALLEQGLTAEYATRLLEHGLESAEVSQQLLDDLAPRMASDTLGRKPLLLVGPTAGGKTTVAMQATNFIAAARGVSPIVSAVRDQRPGAREKFFATADAAKTISSWGGVADESLVIDGGAYSIEELQNAGGQFADVDLCLCTPSYLNRAAATRWLDCGIPFSGVIITHWSEAEVPLGLLAALAERQLPLLGLSASADPSQPIMAADPASIGAAVHRVMELVLATDIPGND